jgi:signal peptidase I
VLLAVVCVAVLGLVDAFLVQPFVIPSGSMQDTLRVGDRVLVDKLAYRFGGQPKRGDVIVFDGVGSFVQDPPATNPVTGLLRRVQGLVRPDDTDYVKRVVGVGGDRVTCCDRQGRIMLNGEPIDERGYLFPGDAASKVPFDIVVPPGTAWVMGDHRSVSSDSRDHLGDPGGGTVPVGKVIGRADWIAWPPGRVGSLHRPMAYASVPSAAAGGHG